MASPKAARPATAQTVGEPRKGVHAWRLNNLSNNPSPRILQESWLRRSFSLSGHIVGAVAELAFKTEATR